MTKNAEEYTANDGRSCRRTTRWRPTWPIVAFLSLGLLGCGRVIAQKATEQLIAGDAVDRTISQIDFRLLTGKKVFLDTQFVNKTVPGVGFVTSEYIVSSIRQKMMCDGCLLEEKLDEADFVVEMRIGALGADGHEIIYGMPPNNYMGLAASFAPTTPQAAAILPSMPELSVAKKNDQMAAAKVALFAYNRRTREPIWQSGITESRSAVADRWFFGAGPFHRGNIYGSKKQTQVEPPLFGSNDEDPTKPEYFVERRFADPSKSLAETPPATAAAAKPVAAAPPAANPPAVTAAAPANAAQPAAAAPATKAAVTATAPPPAGTTPAANSQGTVTTAASANAAASPAPIPVPAAAPTTSAPLSATATSTAGPTNAPASPPKNDRSLSGTPNGAAVQGPAAAPSLLLAAP